MFVLVGDVMFAQCDAELSNESEVSSVSHGSVETMASDVYVRW